MKTKYFLDTEFVEDGKIIAPLSIGLVCDDGREYYAEVSIMPDITEDHWVFKNVIPYLGKDLEARKTKEQIAHEIVKFVHEGLYAPEFWAYYADYDWVLLCQLYGSMVDLPSSWPMFCMDIKQIAVMRGDPDLPVQDENEHHALFDARWNKKAYEYLMMPSFELLDRLNRADEQLANLANIATASEYVRLCGKREGIRLAIGYLNEKS